jgi:hypothetical protein
MSIFQTVGLVSDKITMRRDLVQRVLDPSFAGRGDDEAIRTPGLGEALN